MIKQIVLNGREISYEFQRKQVKNLNLRIKADQSIFVSANESVPETTVEEFLISKSEYILNALDKYAEIAKYSPKPKEYIDGETFKFLGRELRLKVIKGKNQITCDESYITLSVNDPEDYDRKKRMMDRYIKNQCQEVLRSVCEAVYPKFKKYGVDFPMLRFRIMVSRWGSCQPKRKVLTFNIALVEAPISCVEYVVVHEFTHFLEPNHSRRFYQKLAMFMPDWKERKAVLEKGSVHEL